MVKKKEAMLNRGGEFNINVNRSSPPLHLPDTACPTRSVCSDDTCTSVTETIASVRGGPSWTFPLRKMANLCAPLPVRQIPPVVFKAKLPLAHDFQSGPVDILIECDLMYQVIMWDLASPAGKPTAGN